MGVHCPRSWRASMGLTRHSDPPLSSFFISLNRLAYIRKKIKISSLGQIEGVSTVPVGPFVASQGSQDIPVISENLYRLKMGPPQNSTLGPLYTPLNSILGAPHGIHRGWPDAVSCINVTVCPTSLDLHWCYCMSNKSWRALMLLYVQQVLTCINFTLCSRSLGVH